MENAGIEQQIADLERQLQETRSALERNNASPESLPSDKEILHEMVGEKIREHAPEYTPKPPAPPAQVGDDSSPSYFTQDLKDQIQQLINLVFAGSLEEGIKAATKSNNPALIDAFHDVLVDELYTTLLERQKIKEIK